MAKTRAFTSPHDAGLDHMVTARQVAHQRTTQFNGQPTPDRYFSNHRPGKRVPVKHVMKGESCYFSYIGDGSGGHGEGESLNHLLFKEALLSVTTMTLSLDFPASGKSRNSHQIPITITHIEAEKLVTTVNGNRYVDIYLEFQAAHWLTTKWEGKLYLEIHNTHAVDAAKQTELRALGIPLVEVGIPKVFEYKTPEEDTTDDREEAHRQRIKRTLEGPNGYLQGVVLSNPSSKAFLESVAKEQLKNIEAIRQENIQLKQHVSTADDALRQARQSAAETAAKLVEATRQRDAYASAASDAANKLKAMTKARDELQADQRSFIIERRWLIVGICLMTVLCAVSVWMLWTQLPN
ncbi:hypothetical protein PS662_03560 [Pseudomonas fluorescens]|uniref:Uncharacterized protein n=1 Tax=Pseudomonas fluorescens TaxID=294 RepID=A0A5E6UQ95_PSEFL|nr:hypothetical protein [Pseudomonas fluorescens]VVN05214.1 hypothetical protein PS662_03560 [Pseudomonas fluorescens]